MGRDDRRGRRRHRHEPGAGAQGQSRDGLTKGVEFLFKKNKIEWIKGTAAVPGAERSTSSMATHRA
jgi:pyruvate/2-oxoglutarate dehydrogenase complex dihydrolipoamide dehydrogenase (E3) component